MDKIMQKQDIYAPAAQLNRSAYLPLAGVALLIMVAIALYVLA